MAELADRACGGRASRYTTAMESVAAIRITR